MAYVNSVNLTPADGGVAMYELKQLLLTAGWTVIRSTDNVSVANADLWVSGAIANTNQVWMILQKPGGSTNQLAIQRVSAERDWRFYFSRDGYDTSGATGSTTTLPDPLTPGDSMPLQGVQWFHSTNFLPAGGSYRFHIVADNAAPYSFWAGAYPIGGGNPTGFLAYDPVVSGTEATGDTDPYAWLIGHGANTYAATDISYLNYATYVPAYGFLVDATVPTNFVGLAYSPPMTISASGSYTFCFPGGAGTNPFTSNEDLVQALMVRHVSYPAPVGYKGISTLVRFVGTNRSTGDTITVGADTWIVMRSIALPWPTGITPDV